MALRVTHLVDESAPEDGVRLLSLLARLLPAGVEQRVVVIGRTPGTLMLPEHVPLVTLGRRLGLAIGAILDLRREVQRHQPDVVHAVGVMAASVAAALHSTVNDAAHPRVVATISDPAESTQLSRWWRSAGITAAGAQVVCSSEIVRRRVVEAGIPLPITALIRPGVDFGEIRQAKGRVTREELGLPPSGRVLLATSPPSRAGGQYYAVWAMAMLCRIWPDARMIVPGVSREQRRLQRLIASIDCGHVYVVTGDRYSPAELLGLADFVVAPALGDCPTGWLAWAMAAGVPIVASAVPAITEFIADRQNGFLCRDSQPLTVSKRVRAAAESPELLAQCTRLARDQAYEVFRAQRCVSEYQKVFADPTRVPVAGSETSLA